MTDAVLDTFKPSTGGWLASTLPGIATVLVGLAGIGLTIATAGDYGAWPLALTGLAALAVLVKWIANLAARYELTEQRLIIRRGIFLKSIDEIELYRVKDVRLHFTLLNQLAGIGRLIVTSSDETTRNGELVIADVPRAQHRREELRRLVDAARQKRLVREIDLGHEVI